MAWNEPGGGGKDPWGKRDRDGPPDLDEVFRNVQSKVTSIFGKGKGGGGPSSGMPGKLSALGGAVIFVLVVIGWLFSGIYIIQPAERGVITQFGKYHITSLPGPHWLIPWPIQDSEPGHPRAARVLAPGSSRGVRDRRVRRRLGTYQPA